MSRPPRIRGFSYVGPLAVFVTTTTRARHQAFLADEIAKYCVDQILQVAEAFAIEVTAYCFMPDHVHLLATASGESSEAKAAVERWKQKTGFWYRQQTRQFLWQPGYWERVLRDDDDVVQAVRYIVANPVRAGLVSDLTSYRWVGSARFTIEELAVTCQDCERPSWWSAGLNSRPPHSWRD